ncbi:MAG: hypothetical protein ABH879_05670 [archaeon]
MKSIIKRGILLGIGAVSLTKRKAEQEIATLVKSKAITVQDGKELVRFVITQGLKQKKNVGRIVRAEIKKAEREGLKIARTAVAKAGKKGKSVAKRAACKSKKVIKKAARRAKAA